VIRYVERRTARVQNLNKARLLDFVRDFSEEWATDLADRFLAELESLSSVVANRHLIAHGGQSDISLVRAREYRDNVFRISDRLVELFDP
jgi:hypothetical protein